jgi:hypothetical protein
MLNGGGQFTKKMHGHFKKHNMLNGSGHFIFSKCPPFFFPHDTQLVSEFCKNIKTLRSFYVV